VVGFERKKAETTIAGNEKMHGKLMRGPESLKRDGAYKFLENLEENRWGSPSSRQRVSIK
jgi:hypothetical protein